MQETTRAIEREAYHRLPALIAELLDEPDVHVEPVDTVADTGVDIIARDGRGRVWLAEVKSSSRPGTVAHAAERLRRYAEAHPDGIPVLVVPFMSAGGASVAERERLNWLDLSGNAHIRAEDLHVWVHGRPNELRSRGRPSSPFAPKSARVARILLLEPSRWWRQRDLVDVTGLDDGSVSRVVRRLDDELLLDRRDREVRPRDPALLLDAWAQDYRFDRHDIVAGHISGSGVEVARTLADRLSASEVHHAFTGLPAAWAIDRFARFRLTTVYVEGDPRDAADRLELRRTTRGANVQLVGPDDSGVFTGEGVRDGLRCVSPVQAYLDLLHLPERAGEAADHLRSHHLWSYAGSR